MTITKARILASGLLVGCALLAGCAPVYLHDDELQTQTTKARDDYKAADIAGAMKAAIDAQSQIDKADLQAVAENETANRDWAIADLISPYQPLGASQPPSAIARLAARVDARMTELAGSGTPITPSEWVNRHAATVLVTTLDAELERTLKAMVRAYKAAGGSAFKNCDTFQPLPSGSSPLDSAARKLYSQCQILVLSKSPIVGIEAPVNRLLLSTTPGQIVFADRLLSATEKELDDQKKMQADAAAALKKAQEALKQDGKDPAKIDDKLREQLKKLDDLLKDVDKAAGWVDADEYSPGIALAAVEFRKTNLRDIIAWSGSKDADTAESDAAKTGRAIVGVIAGIIKLDQASDGTAPSVPALAVALAFQDGLEKTAHARLDVLVRRKALLEEQKEALLLEFELLAVSRDALNGIGSSPGCSAYGFGDLFLSTRCPTQVRAAAARALSAYNLSWVSGRTPARMAERKVTHQIVMEKLRVAQEAAVARANIQSIALNVLAAYGEGGVKSETVAAFLQAIGIFAIANRVK